MRVNLLGSQMGKEHHVVGWEEKGLGGYFPILRHRGMLA